jgi:HlyD family secretion protein
MDYAIIVTQYSMKHTIRTFLRKNSIAAIVGGLVILTAAGSVWYVLASKAPSFGSTLAMRGNVVASLDEAGTVVAENNASLSFQESGQIARVYVTEGQSISAGTLIASISAASLQAGVAQANAALAAAQARLAQLQAGTRPEQLAIDQTAVANAQATLAVNIGNAYTSADDAIHNQTDNLFSNPRSNNPVFLVPMSNSQDAIDIQSARLTIEAALNEWYASSNDAALATAALTSIQQYLNKIAIAVNDALPNNTMTASVLAGYKVNVTTSRTEIGAAITSITNAQAAETTAQNSLALAAAGATPQDIQTQQAVVAQAQAAASAAQVTLNNASLVAPFSGTIQNLTAQVGQVVAPGVPVASLVNNNGLKIQTYVSEADVAKLKIGSAAQVTLGAFGTNVPFPATVTTIDSAQTKVNGTSEYLVTLHFTDAQPQIKDGMTGNVHILLAEHDNVITVPSRLVINNNNNYFVLVATANGIVQTPVTIGLVDNNGMTEIISGVNEGDSLANF